VVHLYCPENKQRQAGATLVIALIFLVVLSLLGIGMFYSTSSDEAVARNFRDREIALRAAEAAINEAKLMINGMFDKANLPSSVPVMLTGDSCDVTLKGFSCDRATYETSSIDLFGGAFATSASLGSYSPTSDHTVSPALIEAPALNGVAAQPRYLIVLTGLDECSTSALSDSPNEGSQTCFKIFAQGRGRLANTRVNLIEMYLR